MCTKKNQTGPLDIKFWPFRNIGPLEFFTCFVHEGECVWQKSGKKFKKCVGY